MQKISIPKTSVVSALLAACSLLVALPAQAAPGGCSARSVEGNFGYSAEGVLLPQPGVSLQFRSVGVAHFDGNGKLRWQEHTVLDGAPQEAHWTAASGTYLVNPNCTGRAVVNTPNSPVPLNLAFVIVNKGQEVRSILNFGAVSTTFTKIN